MIKNLLNSLFYKEQEKYRIILGYSDNHCIYKCQVCSDRKYDTITVFSTMEEAEHFIKVYKEYA